MCGRVYATHGKEMKIRIAIAADQLAQNALPARVQAHIGWSKRDVRKVRGLLDDTGESFVPPVRFEVRTSTVRIRFGSSQEISRQACTLSLDVQLPRLARRIVREFVSDRRIEDHRQAH